MVMVGVEMLYVFEEFFLWWLKGLVIFMVLLMVYMLFVVVLGILFFMLVDRFLFDDYSEIECYFEDGIEEEKVEWDRLKVEWDVMMEYMDDMMGVIEFFVVYSGLLVFMGLFCILVLWRGDRELGVKLVGVWIGVSFLGGMGMMWMMLKIGFMFEFDYGNEMEVDYFEFIETFSTIVGYG